MAPQGWIHDVQALREYTKRARIAQICCRGAYKKGKELEGGKKLKKFQKTAEEIEKRLPRKNFMINLICQLNPNHKIFSRDYKPPAI